MQEHQCIGRVAVPAPIYRLFDYILPYELKDAQQQLQAGQRVSIEFGRRTCIGVLIEILPFSDTQSIKLKAITDIGSIHDGIDQDMLQLLRWSADYYAHPLGECLQAALPSFLRNKIDAPAYRYRTWEWTGKEFDGPSNAKKQREIIEQLKQHKKGLDEEALKATGATKQRLETLEAKGLIKSTSQTNVLPSASLPIAPQSKTLNASQEKVFKAIERQRQDNTGKLCVSLVEGVTGSGKTEVYIKSCQQILQNNQQALILIPEINLSPQTHLRFQNDLPTQVAVVHSGMSERERFLTWTNAKRGKLGVVVGTRSAIFTPFKDLGIIIIDEEHDNSYKQTEGFKYSARDLAIKRAQIEGIQVILGSATPSLESLLNASEGRYQWLKLHHRAKASVLPRASLIDIRSRELQHGCSRPLLQAIGRELEQKNQVILFQNRRGYAPTLMCQSCGTLVTCPHCDSRMTVHASPPGMQCHHCETSTHYPKHCAECGSPDLKPLGTGTERIELSLKQHFPDTDILRIDRDTTRNAQQMQQHIDFLHTNEPAILIGTQMLAKGHDFPNVTLVGIIDADGLFFSSDFRSIEKGCQLLTQVSGRAGRGSKQGQVLIQTRLPEHPLFEHLLSHDYLSCATEELEERKLCQLPPFVKMVSLRAESRYLNTCLETLASLRREIESLANTTEAANLQISGPFPAAISRKKGIHRAYLSFTCNDHKTKRAIQNKIVDNIASGVKRQCKLFIDVDPIEYM